MMTVGRTGRVGVGAFGGKMRDMSGIDGGLDVAGVSLELMVEEGKSGIKDASKDGMREGGGSSLLVVLGGKSG